MLEADYQERFAKLMAQTQWQIQLPETMSDFFERKGYSTPSPSEDRRFVRARLPLRALLAFSQTISFQDRTADQFMGIFTANVSRCGMGILSPKQLFPEEEIHVLLPTFWFQLKVAHCRRLGPDCYQVGCHLVGKHEPSPQAFAAVPELAQLGS